MLTITGAKIVHGAVEHARRTNQIAFLPLPWAQDVPVQIRAPSCVFNALFLTLPGQETNLGANESLYAIFHSRRCYASIAKFIKAEHSRRSCPIPAVSGWRLRCSSLRPPAIGREPDCNSPARRHPGCKDQQAPPPLLYFLTERRPKVVAAWLLFSLRLRSLDFLAVVALVSPPVDLRKTLEVTLPEFAAREVGMASIQTGRRDGDLPALSDALSLRRSCSKVRARPLKRVQSAADRAGHRVSRRLLDRTATVVL